MANPFANLEDFEGLRRAALEGDTSFERYRRREAASQRRLVAHTAQLRLSDRVQRMVEVAIASSRAVLLVGPPGTGKTEILEQIVDKIDRNPGRFGFSNEGVGSLWATPEEEWTFEKLVLGDTVVDGEIVSVEGELLQAIRNDEWLVLDETNRADMDRVLGGVLTWLSGKRVRVGTFKQTGRGPVPAYLEWTDQTESEVRIIDTPPSVEYAAGTDWRVLGTYNAVDAHRVFRMGQALSRRFKHVPVPPASSSDFREIIGGRVTEEPLLEWLVDRVTRLYEAHLDSADTQLGPGLFIDIPSYVEHGIRMAELDAAEKIASPEHDEVAEDSSGASAATHSSDESSEDSAVAEVVPIPNSDELPSDLREELVAEAYLISIGSFIAKYEPDILDDLSGAVAKHDALTAASWAWIQDSLQAMRA